MLPMLHECCRCYFVVVAIAVDADDVVIASTAAVATAVPLIVSVVADAASDDVVNAVAVAAAVTAVAVYY